LIQWTKPLIKKQGSYILLKGGDLTEEIQEAKRKYPNLLIREEPIVWNGVQWFEQEQKKILFCHFE